MEILTEKSASGTSCREASIPDIVFENVDIITEDSLIEKGSLYISEGKIKQIDSGYISSSAIRKDCSGYTIMPGLIDLHSDALEKHIEPRPGSVFPMKPSICDFDKMLVAYGITSMFYCVAFVHNDRDNRSLRDDSHAYQIIEALTDESLNLKCRPYIHLRYDTLHFDCIPGIRSIIEQDKVNMLSFMDHTPGQGQFQDLEKYKKYTAKTFNINTDDLEERIRNQTERRNSIDHNKLREIADLCLSKNIALASHDDDSTQKIEWAKSMGISISEFPISLEVLKEASQNGLMTMVGAPNVLLGRSHSNNLSALEALRSGQVDIICSDYSPLSLFHSMFVIEKELGLSLQEIAKYVTINPAKAVGIDENQGSIKSGKDADLIFIDRNQAIPRIMNTFVKGQEVYKTY